MECIEYLQKMKTLQNSILDFIRNEDRIEEKYQNILKLIKDYNIHNNCNELRAFLHLIHNISNNHNRTNDFSKKIEKILLLFKRDFGRYFSNSELFLIFKNNKRILYLLFKNDLIYADDFVRNFIRIYSSEHYPEYFKNIIKNDDIANSTNLNNQDLKMQQFDEGENELDYCKIIRNDSIGDFITYVKRSGMSLKTKIKTSIYETNPYLLSKNPSLIEYTAFFGSIQIFRYLYKNNVKLTPSLWIYAIHGFDPEIIYTLESKNIKPKDQTYVECLIEAIECHHNDLVNYIKTNYIKKQGNIDDLIFQKSIRSYNYSLFSDNLFTRISFFNFCRFDYFFLVKQYLMSKKHDINIEINEKMYYYFILTPLLIALRNDNRNVVDILLKEPNIDVNIKYIKRKWNTFEENGSSLYLAIHNNNLEIVKLLLKHNIIIIPKIIL